MVQSVSVKHQCWEVYLLVACHSLALCSCTISELLCDFQHLQAENSLKNPCRNTSVASSAASTKPSSATALFPHDTVEQKAALCVLVDSREISSGADVISSLKAVHGVKVQVCPLSSSDYIVSNRMAVERKFQSELLNSVNRSKVTQRIQRLQGMFERICVIVEKDRVKAGRCSWGQWQGARCSLFKACVATLALCNTGPKLDQKPFFQPL